LPDRHRTVRTAVTAWDQPPLIFEQERLEIRPAMNIDSGTAIVLVYVLVSMGVITASLLAALATGRFIDRLRERRSRQTVPGGERREGSDRSGAAKLNESLLVCRSSPERGIPEPIHVWHAALRRLDRPLLNVRILFAHSLRRLGLEAYHKPGTSYHSKQRTNVRLRPYHYKHRTDADQSCRIPHSHLPKYLR